jgi:hypothetical protein
VIGMTKHITIPSKPVPRKRKRETVWVLLTAMTDAEIASQAKHQDRRHDHKHASSLRAYARGRTKFGSAEMATWPPGEAQALLNEQYKLDGVCSECTRRGLTLITGGKKDETP